MRYKWLYRKDYVVIEMHELWKYITAYFENFNGTLTGFINKFFKVK